MQEAAAPVPVGAAGVASFVAYLAVVIAVGFLAARFSSAGVGEFFVGGRRMHRFVVALSAVVSGRSAWLLLGVTGMAYSRGASAVWAVVGYITVELLLFVFYAPRLRRFAERHDCVTVTDFFARRFADRRGLLRLTLSAVILVFMVSYVAAQFVAGGKAFAASFQLAPATGVLLTAAIVLLYTVLGGFLAVRLTDTIQAFFMIVALVGLPIVAIAERGGLAVVLGELRALDPALVDPAALGFGAFVGFLGIGLGSPGNPHILVRYISIRSPDELRTAAVVGTVWNVVMAWGAIFIGLAGRAFYPRTSLLPAGDTEQLYPLLAQELLHPVLFGMVLASIFAAIMSTADSQLLVAASSVVRDVYEKVLHRGESLPPKRLVRLSRLTVAALVAAALALGFTAQALVFWLVLFAWAGLGAALGPTSILALYWRGTTRAGVVAGLVTGTLTVVIWNQIPALKGALYELVPGFVLALAATWLVSLRTRPPDGAEEMVREMAGD